VFIRRIRGQDVHMTFIPIRYFCLFALLIFVLTGCAGSYYETMSSIQQAVQLGNYQRADELLSKEKDLAQGRNRLLYLLDKGMIAHLNGQYEESNQIFTQAATRIEELDVTSITGTASEWVINDTTQPYRGEDFEQVMVHYYMALNYLMLGNLQEALVECRQLNTLLRIFNDRYEKKNVYKTDAWILYLSGLIYDALGEINDAFIDYRNAYDTYVSDYQENYGTSAPSQLLEHILRTSSALGFADVFETYRQKFGGETWPTQQEYRNTARLVVIWDNGLIPYKAQRIYREYIRFDTKDKDKGCYVKFAFPEFVKRIPTYQRATVSVSGYTGSLELTEDLSQIAIKNLEDRRLRTIVKAIARNTLKCLAEQEIKKQNEVLGWLFAGLTELTEQADTRSWLLLPANISITQILLPPGVSDVELSFSDALGQVTNSQRYEAMTFEKGRTTFLIHRTF
jgi:hypothetical protein